MNTDQTGLDLDHVKLALKTLAKLHAMTYAYFNNANTDVKDFAVTLRLMVDKYYQPSASSEDKSQAKKELEANFEHLLQAQCLKITPKSRIFSILAFFNNFYPFNSDLSGNTEILSKKRQLMQNWNY